jgi:hypothetical protein
MSQYLTKFCLLAQATDVEFVVDFAGTVAFYANVYVDYGRKPSDLSGCVDH